MEMKVRGYVERKSMLYKTGVEYGDYAMNHVQGCFHGCKYPCYAYRMKKRFGKVKSYEEWTEPYLVKNTLELLGKEIPKLMDKIKQVNLCFSTDPFMYGYFEIIRMSIQSIRMLNTAGIKCSVLTKGLLPYMLSDLPKINAYGISLVSLSESFRKSFEPNTAPVRDRINALRRLHDDGNETWVSMEPYPTPNICEQDLTEVLEAVNFVDHIVFGRMNYNSLASGDENKRFYNECVATVKSYCKYHNIRCTIKKGTET